MSKLRWWWMWNSWRLDPRVWWMLLRAEVLECWARLVCSVVGHIERPVFEDDPEGSTYCERCCEYWCGGREWAETRIYFKPMETE